jgi:hypothetical protein
MSPLNHVPWQKFLPMLVSPAETWKARKYIVALHVRDVGPGVGVNNREPQGQSQSALGFFVFA